MDCEEGSGGSSVTNHNYSDTAAADSDETATTEAGLAKKQCVQQRGGAKIGGWFGAKGSGPGPEAADVVPELLNVDEAIQAALAEAGDLAVQHYKLWGAQDLSPTVVGGTQAASRGTQAAAPDYAEAKSGGSQQSAWGSTKAGQAARFSLPDATKTPLPAVPGFALYYIYGVGIPTERSYYVRASTAEPALVQPSGRDTTTPAGTSPSTAAAASGPATTAADDNARRLGTFDWHIDTATTDQGVSLTDGDVTVPLISLGLMCHKGEGGALRPSLGGGRGAERMLFYFPWGSTLWIDSPTNWSALSAKMHCWRGSRGKSDWGWDRWIPGEMHEEDGPPGGDMKRTVPPRISGPRGMRGDEQSFPWD